MEPQGEASPLPSRPYAPGAVGGLVGFAIGVVMLVVGPAVVDLDTDYLIPTWWKLALAAVLASSYCALQLIGRGWIQWSVAVTIAVLCTFLIRVQLDIARDPTDHNLLPFELFFDAISLLVASAIGSGAGLLVQRRSRARNTDTEWRPSWRKRAP